MNVINRILVILAVFITLVIALVMIISPFGVLLVLPDALQGGYNNLSALYLANPLVFTVVQVLLAVVVGLVLLLFLFWEIRPHGQNDVQVKTTGGSKATVTTDSVSQRLVYQIDQLPDVLNVYPRVNGRKESVDVYLQLETTPSINIPAKTEEVTTLIKKIVEEQMGLKLGRVAVHIKHIPYPSGSYDTPIQKEEKIPGGL